MIMNNIFITYLLIFFCCLSTSEAYNVLKYATTTTSSSRIDKGSAHHQNNNVGMTNRREWMIQGLISFGGIAAVTTKPQPAHAVISSKYCAYGTGEGCDDLAEGNELIKQLQAKSAANKEQIQAEARNAYYMKNYPDFFTTVGKTMVKKPDGSFMIVGDAELQSLKDANKITVEYASAMGGKTRDLTQKPILVLKEEQLQ